jgi:hypothetical protein
MEKECRKCKVSKPINSFYKDKAGKQGVRGSCIECEKEMNSLSSKKNYQKNKLKRREQIKEWDKNNLHKRRAWHKKNQSSNIDYRIKRAIRARLNSALKKGYRKQSSISYLGCDLEFFKSYISNLFTDGMSWDNYGEWHIDHIKPLSLFDLSKRDEVQKAQHYTNLQPLWAKDNILKSNKYNL